MTFEEAKNSGKTYNRKKYKEGWYSTDGRGLSCHCQDLSQRHWREEDLAAEDWIVKPLSAKIVQGTLFADKIRISTQTIIRKS
jgi:hypothetical protein